MESKSTHISSLVLAALGEVDEPSASLAGVARKALRIARTRGDWEVAWWLQLEMQTIKAPPDGDADWLNNDGAGLRASAEARGHLNALEFELVGNAVAKRWIGGRRTSKDSMQHLGIPDAEIHAAALREQIDRFGPMSPEHDDKTLIAIAELRVQLRETESLLARLRNEIGVYLSTVERQLILGEVSEDVWARNRVYVDEYLSRIAPKVLVS